MLSRKLLAGLLSCVLSACAHLPASYEHYAVLGQAPPPGEGDIRITFLGATSLLLDSANSSLLIDGFFSRPKFAQVFLGTIKPNLEVIRNTLRTLQVDRLDGVVVVHSHYDHAMDAGDIAKLTGAVLLGSQSTLNAASYLKLPKEKQQLFNPKHSHTLGGFEIIAIPSLHSKPLPLLNDDLGETISLPFKPPVRYSAYHEGGSYDLLVKYGNHSLLVKATSSYIESTLKEVTAKVMFLSTGGLGRRSQDYQTKFLAETIGIVKPALVIPVHWDNLFEPVSGRMRGQLPLRRGLDPVIDYAGNHNIQICIMQGFQSILLSSTTSITNPKVTTGSACRH